MAESIAQRTNQLQPPHNRTELYKLLSATLSDLQTLRSLGLGVLTASATYDAPSLVDGAGVTTTIPVAGANLGDFVVAVALGVDLQSITVTGYVSSAGVVSVRLQNESTGTVDLASSTLRVAVLPQASDVSKIGMLLGAATYDTASLADAAGVTTTITVRGAALGDYVLGSFGLDLQGITATWYVSATDTVSVRIQNETGNTIDLASTTLRCRVLPEAAFGRVAFISNLVGHLKGSGTVDVASLVDGAGATSTVTVTGAVLGDYAIAAHGVDVAGMTVTAYVSAADTVSVRFQNESGGTLDLASTTLNARVIPQGAFPTSFTLQTLA
jgi:hypothetical protein